LGSEVARASSRSISARSASTSAKGTSDARVASARSARLFAPSRFCQNETPQIAAAAATSPPAVIRISRATADPAVGQRQPASPTMIS
jgi:hypothetical protein